MFVERVADVGAQFRRMWATLKTFWWAIVLVVVIVLFGWFHLINRRIKKTSVNSMVDKTPSLVTRVIDRVQGATTDMMVETAIIKSESNIRRKELEEIRAEIDGKKRRERLANILRKSL